VGRALQLLVRHHEAVRVPVVEVGREPPDSVDAAALDLAQHVAHPLAQLVRGFGGGRTRLLPVARAHDTPASFDPARGTGSGSTPSTTRLVSVPIPSAENVPSSPG